MLHPFDRGLLLDLIRKIRPSAAVCMRLKVSKGLENPGSVKYFFFFRGNQYQPKAERKYRYKTEALKGSFRWNTCSRDLNCLKCLDYILIKNSSYNWQNVTSNFHSIYFPLEATDNIIIVRYISMIYVLKMTNHLMPVGHTTGNICSGYFT